MSSLSEALLDLRRRAKLTQGDVADLLQITQGGVSGRETGRVGTPSRDLEQLAAKTGMRFVVGPEGWSVLDADDPFPANPDRDAPYVVAGPSEGVPVVGSAGAGEPCRLYDEPEEWLDLGREWRSRVDAAVQIRGDSMAPMLMDRDWVGIRKGNDVRPGDVVAVLDLREQDLQVKVFWGFRKGGELVLMSYNPDASPIFYAPGTAEIVGTVWGVWRPAQARARVV